MALAGGNSGIMNWVILASAVVPLLIVIVGSWLFLRAGRRWEERERRRSSAKSS